MSTSYCMNLIINYYDSVINTIDIYTEKLLESVDPNDLVDDVGMWDRICKRNRITDFTKCFDQTEAKFTPGVTKLDDYLHSVRQEIIDRVEQCQKDNLNYFRENRKQFEIDPKQLDAEKEHELKIQLFGKSFCFVVNIHNLSPFNLYLIVFDHYLDQDAMDYVR